MRYIIAAILIGLGLALILPGIRRLMTSKRCRLQTAGRYMDRESVSGFRGERFKLRFEYEHGGKTYTSLSDGKFSEDEIVKRGFIRGRRYDILISPDQPELCTCRLRNEYIFECTFLIMAGCFAAAAGALLLI